MDAEPAFVGVGGIDSLPAAYPSETGRAERRSAADDAMDRYAVGDEAAFSDLYNALAPRLSAFIHRYTKDAGRTEDLVQQTLLQMHCARDGYVTGAPVVPWAFAIARRLVIDAHRRRKHETLLASDEALAADDRHDEASMPDEVLQTKEAALRIERALASLPISHREAFALVKENGLSMAEAAQVLGTTVAAVKLRAHRTYEALRAAAHESGVKRTPRRAQ